MIDQVVIFISAGNGGNGTVSGRREKFVPLGGPDGGDGGNGGNITFLCTTDISTLLSFHYKKHFRAEDGGKGTGRNKHGSQGKDLEISVPVGTEVWERDGPGERHLLDLTVPGSKTILAQGGKGGKGNRRFASSTNQYPLLAEAGEKGEYLELRLELKLLADVGIIGAPNAGKSSLLAALTSARPKIAAYPFTTLEPNLGVSEHGERLLVLVDIPGLIAGAHGGVGLGHTFLRHIERTRVVVHVVDVTEENPVGRYEQTREELRLFGAGLDDKPEIVVANKKDVPEAEKGYALLKHHLKEKMREVYFISAAGRQGLQPLRETVFQTLEQARAVTRVPFYAMGTPPVLRPREERDGIEVFKKGRRYKVFSKSSIRIAEILDENNWAARTQFYAHLSKVGVITALEKAGIKNGDTFRVGEIEWEWE